MNERKWYLEHKNGRRWTGDELDKAVRATYVQDPTNECADVFMNNRGTIALMDVCGAVFYTFELDDEYSTDMIVAYDD